MRALTCAFLTLGLVLATCAGCGYESETKKPSVSTPQVPPGTGAGDLVPEIEPLVPSTPADIPAPEVKKEGTEEKAIEKPAEDKPAEDKKTDETKPEEGKKTEEKPEEK